MFAAALVRFHTERQILANLGVSHIKMGDILGHPDFPNMGDRAGAFDQYRRSLSLWNVLVATDTTGALEHYRTALAIFEALSSADPKNANASRSLAIEYEKLGDVLVRTGDFTGVLGYYRQSLGIREALSSADRTNVHVRRDLAGSYEKLGDYYVHLASRPAPADGHSATWRRARSWYLRSLDIWLDFQKEGTLQGSDLEVPGQLAQKIARCEAALAN